MIDIFILYHKMFLDTTVMLIYNSEEFNYSFIKMNERDQKLGYASKEILINLFDNGAQGTKELAHTLKKKLNTISQRVCFLNKHGFIQHTSFRKWGLTEKGKEELGHAFPTAFSPSPETIIHRSPRLEGMEIPAPIPPVSKPENEPEFPEERETWELTRVDVKDVKEEINWDKEFIRLAFAIVERNNHDQGN